MSPDINTNITLMWPLASSIYFPVYPPPPSSPTYQLAVHRAAGLPSRLRLRDLRALPAARRTVESALRGAGYGSRECPAAWWPSGGAATPRDLRRSWPGNSLRTAGHRGRGSRAHRSCPAAWRPSQGRCLDELREDRDGDAVNGNHKSSNRTRSRPDKIPAALI